MIFINEKKRAEERYIGEKRESSKSRITKSAILGHVHSQSEIQKMRILANEFVISVILNKENEYIIHYLLIYMIFIIKWIGY